MNPENPQPSLADRVLEPGFLALGVLLVRLPFLTPGFGLQPDGWRVGLAARAMRATGHYVASRYGANPLHELLALVLLDGLPVLLNLASTLGAVAIAEAVRRLVAHEGRVVRILAGLAAVGLPVVWIESVAAKDYLISTALLVGAVGFGTKEKFIAAGIAMGIAVGFRLPLIALAPALALARPAPLGLRFHRHQAWGFVAFLITAAVALAPSAITHGLGIFHSDDPDGYAPQRLLFSLPAALGPLGLVAFLIAALRIRRPTVEKLRVISGGAAASAGVLFLQAALFVWNPGSSPASYLVPIAPFAVMLVALRQDYFRAPVLALIAVSGVVFGLSRGAVPDASLSSPTLPLPGGHTLHVGYGEVFQNRDQRRREQALLDRAAREAGQLPPEALILGGSWKPKLEWRAPDLEVLYRIDANQAEGRTIYALPGTSKTHPELRTIPLPGSEP